jgi:hypothetical protein
MCNGANRITRKKSHKKHCLEPNIHQNGHEILGVKRMEGTYVSF